ncbi:Uncharacterized protein OBRU01_19410 [Operophtera brumata]|uniref:Uncharacterized protein n=1 Tax=Operophtera brumata TaxID=104452 RepID=A0A0L7KP11_OPEBR|nr:Uncharacterized protein OBRU01_19410 [Operophtera brumata]
MTAKIVILSALFISCNGLSIGTVSEQNVNKSETSIGDVFPDWVPFKNKHGDELGQFVPVTKNKVKKRLALPSNFILKAVAEPEGGDDYGIGQGGGDSEDNYENREWSDLYRPAQAINLSKKVPHTELSDIEGIVNVLTRKPANSLTDKISESRKLPTTILIDESDDEDESEEATTEVSAKVTRKQKYSEEDVDYDESDEKVKKNPVEDVSESEAKKAKILDAVDELKARHTQESRAISEKVKEEEMYKEQFERNRVVKDPVKARDKYGKSYFYKQTAPDYDEYDEKNPLLADKYKVHPIKKQTSSPTPTRTKPIIETTTHKEIKTQARSIRKSICVRKP